MLLLASVAWATTSAASFTTDSGDWVGGTTDGGVLTVTDGAATLTTGAMATFVLDARIRLTTGASITTQAGDAELVTTWGSGGEVALGGTTTALPLAEQAWNPIGTGLEGGEPELLRMDGSWLLYRSVGDSIEAASSADGVVWTEIGVVADGTSPNVVDLGDSVVLYTSCGTAICRVDSDDGLDFGSPAAVLDGALSAVARDADGAWWIWYTDADGFELATSTDGVTFSLYSPLADDGRLGDLDVYGSYNGAWDASDGLHLSRDTDPTFGSSAGDAGPLAFSCDAPTDPSLAMEGVAWYLAAVCDGAPSVALGTPAPGSWTDLHAEWDGTTLTATWGDADPLTVALAAAESISFEANGTLELDEAVLVYDASGDTAETGDTGETADTGDTGDTAADTAGIGDSAGPLYTGADLTGEPGGCGCATAARNPGWLVLGALLVLVGRRPARRES